MCWYERIIECIWVQVVLSMYSSMKAELGIVPEKRVNGQRINFFSFPLFVASFSLSRSTSSLLSPVSGKRRTNDERKNWNRINSMELKIIPTDRCVSFLFNCLWHNASILLHLMVNSSADIVVAFHTLNVVINTPMFGANLKATKRRSRRNVVQIQRQWHQQY